jgi:hypothetical protein
MRFFGRKLNAKECAKKTVPKYVFGRDKMTMAVYNNIKNGQMFINNWNR